jgi:dihydroflavonol-4-reductase
MTTFNSSVTVLVTGASGYLGSWVCVSLLQRGYHVRGTVRSAAKEAPARTAIRSQASSAADERLAFVHCDLTADAGWREAVDGCEYVIHVASDMGSVTSKLDDLLPVARDGTLRVIRAGVAARIKRIVITSSCRVLFDSRTKDGNLTEADWADERDASIGGYPQSKVVAERAAWQEMKAHANCATSLTTVLPSSIQGPVLGEQLPLTAKMISRILEGQAPYLPNMRMAIVDVRDAAEAHVLAMTAPQAAGQRYIVTNEHWMAPQVAQCLKAELTAEEGAKVSTRVVSDWVVKMAACVSAEAAFVAKTLGRTLDYDSGKARRELGWKPRPARETIVDSARALIDKGLVNIKAQ